MSGEKVVVRLALGMNVADLLRIAEVEHLGIVLPGAGAPEKAHETPPVVDDETARALTTMDHLQKNLDPLDDWVKRSEPGDKEILSWLNESLLLISRNACEKLGKDHPEIGIVRLAKIIPDIVDRDLSAEERGALTETIEYLVLRARELEDGYTPPKRVDLRVVAELLRDAGTYAINSKHYTQDPLVLDRVNACIEETRKALHLVMEGIG